MNIFKEAGIKAVEIEKVNILKSISKKLVLVGS